MRLSVIGCGYLGAVHAACMATLGHDVVGIDLDEAKIADLTLGVAPFFEPGLPALLKEALASGRLRFSSSIADARGAKAHFICVGTPQRKGENGADLTYVDGAIAALVPQLAYGDVVIGKSTVPVGTAARLSKEIDLAVAGVVLVWNPEFLREGFAIGDTLSPDRLVYGIPDGEPGSRATKVLNEVYELPLNRNTPLVVTDYATAELVKVAANSFLATKISFINAMAELCEVTGADVTLLADAIGHDARIGRRFLNAGLGFGGGCLPKDIRAFMSRAAELGADEALNFLREVDSINLRRRSRMIELTREVCGGSIRDVRIAVLGAAFKPNSDDVRDSPALDVAGALKDQGASVLVTDPEAIATASKARPDLVYVGSPEEAATDAEVVLLLTEWDQYRNLDPEKFGRVVKTPRILDGRNVLDPKAWRAAGWTFRALGRP